MVLLLTGKKNSKFIPRIKKKKKAANCIFLTTNRVCTNKESYKYTCKCFIASYCPLRIKEKPKITPNENKRELEIIKKYRNIGVCITHNFYGKGQIIEVRGNHITVKFETGKKAEMNLEYCIKNNIIK